MMRCYEVMLPGKVEVKPELSQSDISAMWERLNKLSEKL